MIYVYSLSFQSDLNHKTFSYVAMPGFFLVVQFKGQNCALGLSKERWHLLLEVQNHLLPCQSDFRCVEMANKIHPIEVINI